MFPMCWNLCKSLKAIKNSLCTWEVVQRLWKEESTELWGLFLFVFGCQRFWIWYFKLILSGGVKTLRTTDWSERILTRINIFTTRSNPSHLVSCTLMEYFPNSLVFWQSVVWQDPAFSETKLVSSLRPIPCLRYPPLSLCLCYVEDEIMPVSHSITMTISLILLKLKRYYMKRKT